tara:strand:+ start:160 stop:639 length:480 start_codon:yes stop_codon:yes gene_type:complete
MPQMFMPAWNLNNETDLMKFECPEFLIKRLLSKNIFDDAKYIIELFEEWKRYVSISMSNQELKIPMLSNEVDEVWHNFILFTKQYHHFCRNILQIDYFHHSPTIPGEELTTISSELFFELYSKKFGSTISNTWSKFTSCKSCSFECSGASCINDSCSCN